MSEKISSNKRIAKNTILLYFRMLFTMLVALYTSRVVLNTLGVEDYGIYNVVGGVVTMFTFLNTAMVTSTQRYLNFELGKGDLERLQLVFSTSKRIHVIIAVLIIILTETIGLWFFYNKMVIPSDRMVAAMWVLQLSILTMVVKIMSVPYNALIVAHEDMSVFAIYSILEAILKLLIVYLLLIGNLDKLILYAVLVAAVQLFIRFLYTFYCSRHYSETRSVKVNNKVLMIEMGKFAGWNLWGNLAAMLMGTGVNMLLNMFFGPVVNAARAVAVQVETTIVGFSNNFLMAVRPQITKLYAQQRMEEMHLLLFKSSKFTFLLLLLLSLPIMIEAEAILTLWLKIVPDYTVQFLRLLLIIMLFDSVSGPLQTSAAATGEVKKYQTIVGGIFLSIVPIAYVVLRLGGNPISVYIVYLSVTIVAFISRLLIVKPLIKLSIVEYVNKVLLPCLIVFIVSYAISLTIKAFIPEGTIYSLINCIICVLVAAVLSYFIGMNKSERKFVLDASLKLFNKKNTSK